MWLLVSHIVCVTSLLFCHVMHTSDIVSVFLLVLFFRLCCAGFRKCLHDVYGENLLAMQCVHTEPRRFMNKEIMEDTERKFLTVPLWRGIVSSYTI